MDVLDFVLVKTIFFEYVLLDEDLERLRDVCTLMGVGFTGLARILRRNHDFLFLTVLTRVAGFLLHHPRQLFLFRVVHPIIP